MNDEEKFSFGVPKSETDLSAQSESQPPSSSTTPPSAAPTPSAQPSSHPGAWQPPTPEELQEQIPQYRVLDLLGRGGMGAVYQGWQVSLERYVAIKILAPQSDDTAEAEFSERFKREARTMAKFQHPGIVSVFNAGQTPSGLLFIVMEYIEGTDVARMVKAQGKLAPAHALAITAHVCDALAYAHEHGVIHRDIKPANIMINQEGQVKVADFGLAKASTHETRGLTRASMAMGTPDYIAPEALIAGIELDQRADVYAVGVMLYQMLTGKVPRGHFDMPSKRVQGVDPRFDGIVLQAMQQDREHRYQSARQIRLDLDVILTTAPESAEELQEEQQDAAVHQKPVMKLAGRSSRKSGAHVSKAGSDAGDFRRAEVESTPRRSSSTFVFVLLGAALALGALFAFKKWSDRSAGRSGEDSNTSAQGTVRTTATKDAPFVNSLGMKFVPVPIVGGPTAGKTVLFSIWETRVQDYEVFAAETKREWPKPDFEQGPTHPAVMVSWDDAFEFCAWLTGRERKAGKIGADEHYRLPSDHEWSCAVGIGREEDASLLPAEKHWKLRDVYFWGTERTPPANAGNFWSEELRPMIATKYGDIKNEQTGYRDGYATTAPVGSYKPNTLGLYDLGGNVWERCSDWFDATQQGRVIRGASWHNNQSYLLSSTRFRQRPESRVEHAGIRCVLEVPAPPAAETPASGTGMSPRLVQATKDAPFVNSLGMKFVPVPIIGGPTDNQRVLFSVWETRVQDYEAFATDTKRWWAKPAYEQGPTHPAVRVHWGDATAFCTWLTKRERTAGRSGPRDIYRLPSDHEWTCAAGLADREDPGSTPEQKKAGLPDVYAWGSAWPPPAGAGNFNGMETTGKGWKDVAVPLKEYRDDFPTTAPVGSYPPNRWGLHDLSGNVWEWCEDLIRPDGATRVLRGAAFSDNGPATLKLSNRIDRHPGHRSDFMGFRVVLAISAVPKSPGLPLSPTSADGWQDLLAALTPELVAKSGNGWSLEGGELFSSQANNAVLPLPAGLYGTSYQVRVKLRQRAPRNFFYIALPVGGRMVGFVLDGIYNGNYTGLSQVNGKSGKDIIGTVLGKQLKDSEPHDLELAVRLEGDNATITSALDARPLYEWTGPIAALSQNPGWRNEPGILAFGSNTDDWVVTEVKIKRLEK